MCTLLQQVTVTKLKSTRVAGAYLKVKCQEMQNLYGNNTIFAGTLTWLNMHNKLVSAMKLDIPFILNRSVRSQERLTVVWFSMKREKRRAIRKTTTDWSPSWRSVCTIKITWHAKKKHNKEFGLWRSPAFITSLPPLTMDNLNGSHHQSQVKGSCQSNVLSPVCVHWLVSFAVMLLAVRLKWRRSVVIGRFGSVSEVRSFCSVRL